MAVNPSNYFDFTSNQLRTLTSKLFWKTFNRRRG